MNVCKYDSNTIMFAAITIKKYKLLANSISHKMTGILGLSLKERGFSLLRTLFLLLVLGFLSNSMLSTFVADFDSDWTELMEKGEEKKEKGQENEEEIEPDDFVHFSLAYTMNHKCCQLGGPNGKARLDHPDIGMRTPPPQQA